MLSDNVGRMLCSGSPLVGRSSAWRATSGMWAVNGGCIRAQLHHCAMRKFSARARGGQGKKVVATFALDKHSTGTSGGSSYHRRAATFAQQLEPSHNNAKAGAGSIQRASTARIPARAFLLLLT
mmetsp:Transcript_7796/g.15249  ORF Transcript_7796/g.15249 Transcript_7796/m.15249 type:complete len:124 (+) Transcript_7796:717-1088(+)